MNKLYLRINLLFLFWFLLYPYAASAASSLVITSPHEGDVWEAGKTYQIIWEQSTIDNIAITVLREGAIKEDAISSFPVDISATTGSYTYTVPDSIQESNEIWLRVAGYQTNGTGSALASSKFFSVKNPKKPASGISPTVSMTINGSSQYITLKQYENFTVSWTAKNATYCTGWTPFFDSTTNTFWPGEGVKIPPTGTKVLQDPSPSSSLVSLQCFNDVGLSASAGMTVNVIVATPPVIETPPVQILPPPQIVQPTAVPSSIVLLSPNGGEVWKQKQNYILSYQLTGSISRIGYRVQRGGVTVFTAIGPINVGTQLNLFVDSSFIPNTTYKVTLYDWDHPDISDESNSSFSVIQSEPTVDASKNKVTLPKTPDILFTTKAGSDVKKDALPSQNVSAEKVSVPVLKDKVGSTTMKTKPKINRFRSMIQRIFSWF